MGIHTMPKSSVTEKTGKHEGKFVTAMEAARRARGISGPKCPVIQTDHGEAYEFMMALHINDLVSIEVGGKRQFYRVQKLEYTNSRVGLQHHTVAAGKNSAEQLEKPLAISTLMETYTMQKHQVNAIGKLRND